MERVAEAEEAAKAAAKVAEEVAEAAAQAVARLQEEKEVTQPEVV